MINGNDEKISLEGNASGVGLHFHKLEHLDCTSCGVEKECLVQRGPVAAGIVILSSPWLGATTIFK